MDGNNSQAVRRETPQASLPRSQLDVYAKSMRCLYAIAAFWHRAGLVLRAALNLWHRSWSAYLIKSFGVIVAITFGTASLFYAKEAADDARCQLRLAERQYCETADKMSANSTECQVILREPPFARPCQPRATLASYSATPKCGDHWHYIPVKQTPQLECFDEMDIKSSPRLVRFHETSIDPKAQPWRLVLWRPEYVSYQWWLDKHWDDFILKTYISLVAVSVFACGVLAGCYIYFIDAGKGGFYV